MGGGMVFAMLISAFHSYLNAHGLCYHNALVIKIKKA